MFLILAVWQDWKWKSISARFLLAAGIMGIGFCMVQKRDILQTAGSVGVGITLLVLNKSSRMWTMPLFMFNFKNQYSFEANLAFAAFLLALLPILALYIFMQKYIVSGLTAGAVKG